tara:strand:+ start:306 stop:782 length:477 start_codon:yes stop_codon:yes gene_type:complete
VPKVLFWFLVCLVSCNLKSKTDLYLERDLDVLGNKVKVDFYITENIYIKEVAIIRDKKEAKKTLVISLDASIPEELWSSYLISIEAKIIDSEKEIRIEKWDFTPSLTKAGDRIYILKDIKVKESKIQNFTLRLFKIVRNEKIKEGKTLNIKKLHTNND